MASRSIDQISKKTNCTCSTLFFLSSKKINLHVQHAFRLSLPLFLHNYTVGRNRQTSQFHIIFMEELSYVLTQYFVSCVHMCAFIFHCPSFLTLLAAPYWPLAFLIRDLNIQRRKRQRERQKTIRLYKQNNNFARASRFFGHFFARFCTTTT